MLFQMIYKNCEDAVDFTDDGEVIIRGEKIDDALVKRLKSLMEMWGIGFKNSVPTLTKKK